MSSKQFKSQLLKTLFVIWLLLPLNSFTQDLKIIRELEKFHPDKGSVSINQAPEVSQLLNKYYVKNASRPGLQGFRIRIFFDLGQQSRNNSQEVTEDFMANFQGIPVYRTFDSPYYKVSIGDYRSRDEALKMLKTLNRKYPKAFIVPEWINFPQLD